MPARESVFPDQHTAYNDNPITYLHKLVLRKPILQPRKLNAVPCLVVDIRDLLRRFGRVDPCGKHVGEDVERIVRLFRERDQVDGHRGEGVDARHRHDLVGGLDGARFDFGRDAVGLVVVLRLDVEGCDGGGSGVPVGTY